VDTDAEESGVSFASVPPTEGQRRAVLALIIALVAAFCGITPFALVPLPRTDGYIPAVQAVISATDFVTAALVLGQFATAPSRGMLVLGYGYLFSALTVVAHTLTFPGAFASTGLLGAGPQTSAWIYVAWHLGLPLAVIGYVALKSRDSRREPPSWSIPAAISWGVAVVLGLVGAIMWITIAWHDALPRLIVSETAFSDTTTLVMAPVLLTAVVALALLSANRSSMLDWWLMLAMSASVAEAALVTLIGASRYTVAFYSGRMFAVVVSSAVLVALLWELTRLYARLSLAVRSLERERAIKLLNVEVLLGAVAHEIKQPLTAVSLYADATETLLKRPSPDLAGAEESVEDIKRESARIANVLESIRALARNPEQERKALDVNELVVATLELLRSEVEDNDIQLSLKLAPALQPIAGHPVQLQEVLLNLVSNAIDSMRTVTDRPRTLHIETGYRGEAIEITIHDSGCGIEPERLDALFDARITTKAHGMGLGLAICRLIVERHGGRISASSEVGRGSRFEMTLPIAGAMLPIPSERADAKARA